MIAQGPLVSAPALRPDANVRKPAHVGNVAASFTDRVLDGLVGAAFVIYRYRAGSDAVEGPIEKDERDALVLQGGKHTRVIRLFRNRDEQPVDPHGEQGAQVPLLEVGPLLGHAEHDLVLVGRRHLADARQGIGKEGMRNLRDNDPQRARLVGREGAREAIGRVAHLLRELLDPLLRLRRYVRVVA